MRYFTIFCVLLLNLGLYGQSVPPTEKDSVFVRSILQRHNELRHDLQLPYLAWSDELAADARAWAKHLAETDRGDHDLSIRGREGENIWWGTANSFSYTEMVNFWGDEKKGFVYGVFPDCKKGRSTVVGHYTQIIWRTTTAVGCALATNGKMDYLVCRYAPAGNMIGQKPY